MARSNEPVIIGVGSHVVAIDPSTGTEIWRTKLKMAGLVTVSVAGRRVYAGASGELFCLDVATGDILWRNRLKGLGMGVVAFPGSSDLLVDAEAARQRQASGAAAL